MKPPFLSLLLAGLTLLTAHAADQPDILFIFADDQCYDTLGAFGHPEVETPNLDRLASRSTQFSHAYNMGSWSGAVCVASRTMLNTGRYLWEAQAESKNKLAESKGQMWSELLAGAGYDTYFTGKWHVPGANADDHFKVTQNIRPGMPNQTPEGYNRPIDGQPDPWDPTDPKFEGFWKGGRHWSAIVADDAEEFIQTASQSENPFFIYAAFNAPHDPRQAPQEYVNRYPLHELSMPINFRTEYPWNEAMKSGRGLRDEKLAPFPRTENAVKVNRQEYFAIITHMDTQIGRILDELESSGRADNTWIFFSADHGLAVGQHGLMGKQNMYDHSVRVPLLVSGPGVEAGSVIDQRVYLQDVMATTLELAGAERPDHVDFLSLLPHLQEGSEPVSRDAIYGAYLNGQRMITKGDHKLILYPNAPVALLYDLTEDPHETTNLAHRKAHFPLMKELFARLQELQAELGDELDLKEAFPELQ